MPGPADLSAAGATMPGMAEYRWQPPSHPEVELHRPVELDAAAAGDLVAIDQLRPVRASIELERRRSGVIKADLMEIWSRAAGCSSVAW
jgi:hypothetical protein